MGKNKEREGGGGAVKRIGAEKGLKWERIKRERGGGAVKCIGAEKGLKWERIKREREGGQSNG